METTSQTAVLIFRISARIHVEVTNLICKISFKMRNLNNRLSCSHLAAASDLQRTVRLSSLYARFRLTL